MVFNGKSIMMVLIKKIHIIDEGYFMHKRITFRSMDHSNAIENYINKKIEKIKKFFKREPQPIYIDIILELNREKHAFKIECKLHSVHYHLITHGQGPDIYLMIDNAISKMIKDISRKKERFGHELHLSYV